MTPWRTLDNAAQVIGVLDDDALDVVHIGIFDLDATFRERRLPRAQAVQALEGDYSFVDVLHQWDTAEAVHDGVRRIVDEPVRIEP